VRKTPCQPRSWDNFSLFVVVVPQECVGRLQYFGANLTCNTSRSDRLMCVSSRRTHTKPSARPLPRGIQSAHTGLRRPLYTSSIIIDSVWTPLTLDPCGAQVRRCIHRGVCGNPERRLLHYEFCAMFEKCGSGMHAIMPGEDHQGTHALPRYQAGLITQGVPGAPQGNAI
jgi:hypothetical protein